MNDLSLIANSNLVSSYYMIWQYAVSHSILHNLKYAFFQPIFSIPNLGE